MSKKKPQAKHAQERTVANPSQKTTPPSFKGWEWLRNTHKLSLFLFAFGALLYANTLGHDYAQDDAIVITDNMFTTQGMKGIPGLFTYDTFFGFFKVEGKAKLVSGGRYRPLTPAMFAVEYALFGDKPGVMHFFNALWYGLTVVVLYQVLLLLFGQRAAWDDRLKNSAAIYWIPLLATLVFAAHPLHTEAVANIKGRDEIITLLGSLAALGLLLKGRLPHLVGAGVCFFL
ncbi:MAG: hypothetical protein R2795_03750, partial [Saprospiraceae bacterium]